MTHVVTLRDTFSRARAMRLIDQAPDGHVMRLGEAKRSLEQNDKLWAMLTDVSIAKPEGRRLIPEDWKVLFMHACGWECQFLEGLDGRPFPKGFSSSRLTKAQMSNLIEFIQAWGDERGVRWTPEQRAA